jgi:hypothetical protein
MPCWVAVLDLFNHNHNMKNEIEHKSISFLLTVAGLTMYIVLAVDLDHKMYTNMQRYLHHCCQNKFRR